MPKACQNEQTSESNSCASRFSPPPNSDELQSGFGGGWVGAESNTLQNWNLDAFQAAAHFQSQVKGVQISMANIFRTVALDGGEIMFSLFSAQGWRFELGPNLRLQAGYIARLEE